MVRINPWILLSIAFLLKGVQLQQTKDPLQKPKIVWAAPIDRYSNQWNALSHNDRQWMLPDPPTIINTPPPTTLAPIPPSPSYQAPPSYQPPTTPSYQAPAPAPYQQPDPYQPPASPSYPAPDPAQYRQPDPYQPPAAPSYPAPSPYYPPAAYDPPQAPQATNGYYYYYYPAQKPEQPSWKDLLKKEKEALDAMSPVKNLSEAQKIWIAVLAPLIVVALVVPLAAILFSNFTITVAKRSEREFNTNSTNSAITHEFSEMAARAGALLESDECMQRIICTLGSYTSAVPGKSYLLGVLDNMVPDTMQNNMKIFKEAANDEEKDCKRFKCSSWNF